VQHWAGSEGQFWLVGSGTRNRFFTWRVGILRLGLGDFNNPILGTSFSDSQNYLPCFIALEEKLLPFRKYAGDIQTPTYKRFVQLS
jgi:hypothetical protein